LPRQKGDKEMKIAITPQMAMLAGMDEGNRNMRKEGRTAWNENDWDIAAKKAADIFLEIDKRRPEE